jgi:hypothetical protein
MGRVLVVMEARQVAVERPKVVAFVEELGLGYEVDLPCGGGHVSGVFKKGTDACLLAVHLFKTFSREELFELADSEAAALGYLFLQSLIERHLFADNLLPKLRDHRDALQRMKSSADIQRVISAGLIGGALLWRSR